MGEEDGAVQSTDWVAVDWGTSNLRAWGIATDGAIAFEATSAKGMAAIAREDFPGVLLDLLAPHIGDTQRQQVLVCGMAGARQGWIEAPYLTAPADLTELAKAAVIPPDAPPNLSVAILPGVCQRETGGENVMRGEETQLLGVSSLVDGFTGAVCMPGTHSKWAALEGSHISRFATAMTGEMFDILRTHSVLRHSLVEPYDPVDREDGFAVGSQLGLHDPGRLTSTLFTVRAAALVSGRSSGWCAGYLSGLLIGTEIAASKDWFENAPVVLVGAPGLTALYARVLSQAGAEAKMLDATAATLAGLASARRAMSGS